MRETRWILVPSTSSSSTDATDRVWEFGQSEASTRRAVASTAETSTFEAAAVPPSLAFTTPATSWVLQELRLSLVSFHTTNPSDKQTS